MSLIVSILNYLNGIELIFGTVLNVLTIFICAREKLRKTPTFIFMGFISISNLLKITIVSSTGFIDELFHLDLASKSWAWCKLINYIDRLTFNWCSWLFITVTLEVFLSVHITNFRKKYLTLRRTVLLGSFYGSFFALLESPVLFLSDLRDTNMTNLSSITVCLAPYSINTFYSYFLIVSF